MTGGKGTLQYMAPEAHINTHIHAFVTLWTHICTRLWHYEHTYVHACDAYAYKGTWRRRCWWTKTTTTRSPFIHPTSCCMNYILHYMYACVCVRACACACVCVRACVRACVFVNVHMHIYTHIHTYRYISKRCDTGGHLLVRPGALVHVHWEQAARVPPACGIYIYI